MDKNTEDYYPAKIISCINSDAWYKDMVGQTIWVKEVVIVVLHQEQTTNQCVAAIDLLPMDK